MMNNMNINPNIIASMTAGVSNPSNQYKTFVTYDNSGQAYYFDKDLLKLIKIDNSLVSTDPETGRPIYSKEYNQRLDIMDQYGQLQHQMNQEIMQSQGLQQAQARDFLSPQVNQNQVNFQMRNQMINQPQQMMQQPQQNLDLQIQQQMQAQANQLKAQQIYQQQQTQQAGQANLKEEFKDVPTIKAVDMYGNVVEVFVDSKMVKDVLDIVENKMETNAQEAAKKAMQNQPQVQQPEPKVETKPNAVDLTVATMPTINTNKVIQPNFNQQTAPVIPQQPQVQQPIQTQQVTQQQPVSNIVNQQPEHFQPDPSKSNLQNYVDSQSVNNPAVNF